MIKIIIGLIASMLSNVLMGGTLAKLKEEFTKDNFIKGLVKIGCVVIGVGLLMVTSILNPDIMVINLNGQSLNVMDALKAIFIAGIVFYSGQSIIKLVKIIKVPTNVAPIEEPTIIEEIKEEN